MSKVINFSNKKNSKQDNYITANDFEQFLKNFGFIYEKVNGTNEFILGSNN